MTQLEKLYFTYKGILSELIAHLFRLFSRNPDRESYKGIQTFLQRAC